MISKKTQFQIVTDTMTNFEDLYNVLIMSTVLFSLTERQQVVQLLSSAVTSIIPTKISLFAFCDDDGEFKQIYGKNCEEEICLHLNQLISNPSFLNEVQNTFSIKELEEFHAASKINTSILAPMYVIPVKSVDRTHGIFLFTKNEQKKLTDHEAFLLQTLCSWAAITMENLSLRESQHQTIKKLEQQEKIILEQNNSLKKSEEIHKRFTAMVVNNSGMDAFLHTLSNLTDKFVVFTDQYHHIKGCSRNINDSQFKELLAPHFNDNEPTDNFSDFLENLNKKRKPTVFDQFLVSPIFVQNEVLGYIYLFSAEHMVSPLDIIATEHATTALALEMMKIKISLETSQRLRSDFFDDLIHANYINKEDMVYKASYFQFDLNSDYYMAVIEFITCENNQKDQSEIFQKHKEIYEHFKMLVDRDLQNSILIQKGSRLLLFVAKNCLKHPIDDIIHELISVVQQKHDVTLVAGIGSLCSKIDDYPVAYKQANICLQVINKFHVKPENKVFHFKDLGIYRLLYSLSKEELTSYVNDILNPLLEQNDVERNDVMLTTLEAFLQNDCSLKNTAVDLFVHVGTVKYRLNRIQEMTDYNLEDMEQKMNLMIALKIYRLFY